MVDLLTPLIQGIANQSLSMLIARQTKYEGLGSRPLLSQQPFGCSTVCKATPEADGQWQIVESQ